MTIRPATVEDVPAIAAMGQEFASTSTYAAHMQADPGRLAAVAGGILANPDAAMWVCVRDSQPIGMLAMAMVTHPLSGDRIASEIVWWVDPSARGAGLRLLRTAERWAKALGAVAVHMIAPTERVGQLYAAIGYAPVETNYYRRF